MLYLSLLQRPSRPIELVLENTVYEAAKYLIHLRKLILSVGFLCKSEVTTSHPRVRRRKWAEPHRVEWQKGKIQIGVAVGKWIQRNPMVAGKRRRIKSRAME
jgi:hypothetical protein